MKKQKRTGLARIDYKSPTNAALTSYRDDAKDLLVAGIRALAEMNEFTPESVEVAVSQGLDIIHKEMTQTPQQREHAEIAKTFRLVGEWN